MRVAVMGAGAIGLLYGGWLQAAGGDVCFLARGERLEALHRNPLTASGKLPFHLEHVEAVAPSDAQPADVVLLAVKLYDLAEATEAALPLLGDTGVLIAVQNGVAVYEALKPIVPAARLAVGPVYAATKLIGPAAVSYGGSPRIILGNPDYAVAPVVEDVLALWRKAGIEASLSNDIGKVIWTKFLGLATNAALTCLARQPAGVIYHDPDLLELVEQSIAEVMAVGRAEGIEFDARARDETLAVLQGFPYDTVASMRQDLDAGKRLELDGLTGEIVRLGRKHEIATPLHKMAYALLKPYRDGRPSA